MTTIEFSPSTYQAAVSSGLCTPPGMLRKFIHIDRTRFHTLRAVGKLNSKLHLDHLRKRLPCSFFTELRSVLGLILLHAQTRFPAYRFLAPEYINEEWLASVDWHKKFHRDHVLHQAMCVHVGFTLLQDLKVKNGENLLTYAARTLLRGQKTDYLRTAMHDMGCAGLLEHIRRLPDTHQQRFVSSYILEVFFLTALFHDLGYPWQFTGKINAGLGTLAAVGSMPSMDPNTVIRHYGDRLLMMPFKNYIKNDPTCPITWHEEFKAMVTKGLANTHGLPGAISFLHLNDQLRIYPGPAKPLGQFGLEWAAMAIMMHDLGKMYAVVDKGRVQVYRSQLRVNFDRDPLSFLMTITDLIQDYGRPDASFIPNHDDVKITFRHRCAGTRIEWDETSRTLRIVYKYRNYADFKANKTLFLPETEQLYFDPLYGYLDPGSLDIRRIRLDAEHEVM